MHPQCSVQCPTPGRWNRMHYSCLQGAGFEVSVCIMKAERIMIVMLYRSLVLSLPLYFSLSFSLSLSLCFPFCHSFFVPVCLNLFWSILLLSFFFLRTFALFATHAHWHARTHKHLLILFSWFIMSVFPFVGRGDWLKPELLKGHTRTHETGVSRPISHGSMGWYQN